MKQIVLFIALILFSIESYAAKKPSLPAVLKADKIDADQNTNIINASGNVELEKDGNTLFTDKLSYDKNSQNITATGGVKIKNYTTGNVLAKNADVKSDFKSGNFYDATIIFNDGSYIKSPKATKINESETILKTPTFSICPNDEIKEDNLQAGAESDVISITSKQTVIDKSTNSVKSKHGVVWFYKVPILYSPYLKFPIPSSKRKTGFLHPSYVQSTKLGTGFKIPYYFNIAPDKDLTTTMQIHPSENHLILDNKYRQLTKNGSYLVDLQLANNKPKNNNLVGSKESKQSTRWYLKSSGESKLPKDFNLDFNIDNVGDKNYLRDYSNQFYGYTTSEINLDYIKDKDYGAIKTVKIQELEVNLDEKEAPIALPILNYYTEKKPEHSLFNQTYSLLANSTTISRRSGLQYRRISLKPEIKIPYNLSGNIFELSGNVQGDFYNVENNFESSTTNNNFKSTTTNYRPELNLKWSLPMFTKHKENTLILEPMVTIATSTYTNGNKNVPNEDSNNTQLTQGNLFLSDRLVGFDRNEAGQRISYGFKSSLFNDLFGQFNLGLGQSWRQTSKIEDTIIRGFNDSNKSNIVGEISYNAKKILNITYIFQLNESNYRNDVNELSTNLDFGKLKIGNSYIFLKKSTNNAIEREQTDSNLTLYITKKLVFDTGATYDLVSKRKINRRFGLNYNGCCISYGITFSENNPSALTKPEKSYNISFVIKNL
jgi:LPS-assembly protein